VDCQVAAYERSGLSPELIRRLENSGVSFTALQKGRGFCTKTVLALRKIILAEKIRVIHTHDLGALIYGVAVALCCFMRVKVVHTQHSFVHFRKGLRRYSLYEKLFCSAAKAICTVSPSIAHQYRKLGIPQDKLLVVANGVEFAKAFATPSEARARLMARHGASMLSFKAGDFEKSWLLSLGRVVAGKGHERLLRTWVQLPDSVRQQWKLVIVGPVDPRFMRDCILPILQNSPYFAESVLLVGPTDHPSDWLFASDAFVSLSEEEGMPLAVCEAIGAGLPALLTDIDGHQSVRSYVHFAPRESNSIDVQIFIKFLEESAASSGNRPSTWESRERFRIRHSSEKMAQDYRNIYSRAVKIVHRSWIHLLALIINFALSSSSSALSVQRLTSTLEKPEYLVSDDFKGHLVISLAAGEKRLIIFENKDFCGTLPTLHGAPDDSLVDVQWYLGRTVNLKNPSFEGARTGSYVDALVPLRDSLDCANPEFADAQWLFADLTVAENAFPEDLSLYFESTMHPRQQLNHGAEPVRRWSMTLRILPFTLSEPWALPLAAEFTPYFASLAHFGRSDSREGALTQKYIKEMVAHRILPLKAWIKHPFKKEEEQLNQDFLLSRDPSPQLSYLNTVVSELPWWSEIDIPRIDHSDEQERLKYWMRWQEFLDVRSADPHEAEFQERMSRRPFVYLWDEPQQEEFHKLRKMTESLRQGAPQVSALVTIYPWQSLLDSIRIFAPLLQTLEREGPPSLTPEHQLWAYVSCMSHGCGSEFSSGEPDFVIERNASYIRVWPWISEIYNLQRVLYYSVNNSWRKSPAVDPWQSLWDFTGNGDGTLFYPAREGKFALKEETPLPSLRMKLWRQASFDAEYIAYAKMNAPECFGRLRAEMPLAETAFRWSRNSRQYDQARDQLVECLFPTSRDASTPQGNP
jgi:glycosyltransferase involved in cell wall biosynthesis